jgi:peroxiredoxin
LLLGAVVGLSLAGSASAIEVGQKAPDFTLAAPGNKQVKLSDLLGKGPVVIYTFVDAFGAA